MMYSIIYLDYLGDKECNYYIQCAAFLNLLSQSVNNSFTRNYRLIFKCNIFSESIFYLVGTLAKLFFNFVVVFFIIGLKLRKNL